MIGDLMTSLSEQPQQVPVFIESRVLTYDEEGYFEVKPIENVDDLGYEQIQIRRELLPSGISVDLHVSPQVVEIQRYACFRLVPVDIHIGPLKGQVDWTGKEVLELLFRRAE